MRGILTVYTGPMFAGKSARLLAHDVCGKTPLYLAPAFDTRSGSVIRSRTGAAVPARSIKAWPDDSSSYAHVLIDEVHFLSAPYYDGDVIQDILSLLDMGSNVTVAGLDTDYRRHGFDIMTRLIALADHVHLLEARCHHCAAPARWTAKKRQTGLMFETGDSELYEACCDSHWSCPDF